MPVGEIIQVRKQGDNISHVYILMDVESAHDMLKREPVDLITNHDGRQAKVYPKQTDAGKKFLTTTPDDTKVNNLDFLPEAQV